MSPLAAARASLLNARCVRGSGVWSCERANDGSVCSVCAAASHLRAAFERVDALEAEANGGYLAVLQDCDDLLATALKAAEIGAFPGPAWRARASDMRTLIEEVTRG